LGVDAVAVAVQLRDPQRAVQILEHSRALLIGQSLEQYQDTDALHSVAPDLADEFTRLGALLAADTAASTEFDAGPALMADPAAARRDALERWEDLITRIRCTVSGHEQFLEHLQFHDLKQAATSAPVVIVNVSRYRSDALIVRSSGVTVEPLNMLSPEDVSARVQQVMTVTETKDAKADADADADADAVIVDVLDCLWTAVAAPVLAALGPGESSLWWMPTGALSALPLHAAASRAGGPAVLDQVVSSTTTTLRALIDVLGRGPAPRSDAESLIVAMAETAGHASLPRAAAEADAVAALIGGHVRTLHDRSATPSTVQEALRGPGTLCLPRDR
jgi:hypothetical protein